MRTIPASLKFLHCMSNSDYLAESLSQGLMLTDHEIRFSPTQNHDEFEIILNRLLPLLNLQLNKLGHPLQSLSEDRQRALFLGLGAMSGKVPMLCFSEIPLGKSIDVHRRTFGSFSLVIKPEWLALHNADRVVYVGMNSPISQHLFHCIGTMHLLGLHVASEGDVLYDNITSKAALELFSYIQMRDHLEESEWRIAGSTGFMGGVRETNKRLQIKLEDIEYILVPKDHISRFTQQVEELAGQQNCSATPVLQISSYLP